MFRSIALVFLVSAAKIKSPSKVCIALDGSTSVSDELFTKTKETAKQMIQGLKSFYDEDFGLHLAFIQFSNNIQVLTPMTSKYSKKDNNELDAKIDGFPKLNGTTSYTSVLETCKEQFKKKQGDIVEEDFVRIIIIISDGVPSDLHTSSDENNALADLPGADDLSTKMKEKFDELYPRTGVTGDENSVDRSVPSVATVYFENEDRQHEEEANAVLKILSCPDQAISSECGFVLKTHEGDTSLPEEAKKMATKLLEKTASSDFNILIIIIPVAVVLCIVCFGCIIAMIWKKKERDGKGLGEEPIRNDYDEESPAQQPTRRTQQPGPNYIGSPTNRPGNFTRR